jgi:hypothetical protein
MRINEVLYKPDKPISKGSIVKTDDLKKFIITYQGKKLK